MRERHPKNDASASETPARDRRRDARSSEATQIVDALVTAAQRALGGDVDVALSMRKLARSAGVSIGSLYYYFRNQEELLLHLVGREDDALVARLLQAIEAQPSASIEGDVGAVFATLRAWQGERGWVSKIPVTYLFRGETLTRVFDRGVQAFTHVIDAICARNGKRAAAAHERAQLIALLYAVQGLWALGHPAAADFEPTRRMVQSFLATLENAPQATPAR